VSSDQLVALVVWAGGALVVVLAVLLKRRARRHGGAMRAGIVGALYDWQNRDKQKALDLIVEGRAEERRPEYPDGNLPELEGSERGDESGASAEPEGREG